MALEHALKYQDTLSPFGSPGSSPTPSPRPSPTPNNGSLVTLVPDSSTSTSLQVNQKQKCTQKDKEASKQWRINWYANMPPTICHPCTKEWPDPSTIPTLLNCSNSLPVESTGFSGRTSVSGLLKPGEHWTIDELTDMGFGEIPWDGKCFNHIFQTKYQTTC